MLRSRRRSEVSGGRRLATCVLCEAACGIVVDVDGDRVASIRGDADDPMSRGYVCPKVIGMRDLHEDPDRLRRPLVRSGGAHREATWEEALRVAGDGLRRVRKEHAADAVAVYQGNPAAHNLGLLTVGQIVLRSLGTKNLYSASSSDQVPQMLAAELMFGNPVLMPVPDLERTGHLLVFGANPLVSNGSLMTAPNMRARLAAIRARGGRVVVVDPRRTETAEAADEHVFIAPASDPWLLLGMLRVVFEEGLARPERWVDRCNGWAELEALALSTELAAASAHTRVPAETIARLARDFARAESAAVYGRVGICHQPHGSLAAWLLYALATVTGNLDRAGGSMFTSPAVEVTKLVRMLGFVGHGRWKSRVRGLPEVAGELPIATLADEIETSGAGQVRALLTCAGNPALSAPNGKRLDAALSRLSFMVSVDGYLNETTRHANVILPPVSPLERSHYDVALNAFAVRNFAKYVPRPLPKPPDGRDDWEILLELGARVWLDGSTLGRAARAVSTRFGARLGPEAILEGLLRGGPRKLSLGALKKHPSGLDLGPLEPIFPAALETRDKRVLLAPPELLTEAKALLRTPVAAAERGFVLIGRRHLRSNNSWLHNSHALIKGPERCTLMMHPDDAGALGLGAGASVEIESRVGRVEAPLELTDSVMRGVVSLPHGFGHGKAGARLGVAARHAGVSANDLTDDQLLDAATGNAAFSAVRVEVRALERDRPGGGRP
jgi:anaerobic selenocysteine-containing dehydrogenase